MRNIIFISHATEEIDNEFSKWLTLQLVGAGYEVWCDLLKLKGGEDFWEEIEDTIRNKCIKFLYVLSQNSNNRDGTLKELTVAQKVAKQINDNNFIIPLHIDQNLTADDINIDLVRIQAVDFKKNWAKGFCYLQEKLEEDEVPHVSENYTLVSDIWKNIFLQNETVLDKEEIYASNWFRIFELPEKINFHKYAQLIPKKLNIKDASFPAFIHKEYVATFAWVYDFMEEWPRITTYDPNESYSINIADILSGEYDTKFISNKEAKKLLVKLLNKSLDNFLDNHNLLSKYEMSNRRAYWLKNDIISKNRVGRTSLVGIQKDKFWHFGVSGNTRLYPELIYTFNSHIFFTSDGENLIPEASKQHAARRKQGKNWWNKHWRNRLFSFLKVMAGDNDYIEVELGNQESLKIDISSINFISPKSYLEPNKEPEVIDEGLDNEEEV